MLSYKLKSFIDESKLDWSWLSLNPKAIDLLQQNIDKIDWYNFSRNPNAIPFLEKNIDKINWNGLSSNPEAISLLLKNKDLINWRELCSNTNGIDIIINKYSCLNNPEEDYDEEIFFNLDWCNLSSNINAIDLLLNNYELIDWMNFSGNLNAIKILLQYKDEIDWIEFSTNENAIDFLTKNTHLINIKSLCYNQSKDGIRLLMNYPTELYDWEGISINPSAINIIEDNMEHFIYSFGSSNPEIFTYDYDKLKKNKEELHLSLIEYLYHPSKISKYLETNDDITTIYIY